MQDQYQALVVIISNPRWRHQRELLINLVNATSQRAFAKLLSGGCMRLVLSARGDWKDVNIFRADEQKDEDERKKWSIRGTNQIKSNNTPTASKWPALNGITALEEGSFVA